MGPGKTLGRLEGQFAHSSQAVSTLRKLKADGGQSGSVKRRDPSVCYGSICLRSYSARRSEAEQGNNCVTLRVKIILGCTRSTLESFGNDGEGAIHGIVLAEGFQ